MSAVVTTEATGLQLIPLAAIHESPWNPRKHFDPNALAELADSLRAVGQLTPALVRPRPKGGYELAAGHRRCRAAVMAGLGALLCVVRALDDQQMLEVLTIENLQRDDLHPLEEAEGFAALMTRGGYDVAKIAARVGRSIKYVYDRLKLRQLTPEAKDLFGAGAFTAGHAILLARLSPADQARACASDRSSNYRTGGLFTAQVVEATLAGELAIDDPRKPVSVREFEGWIDKHVRFDTTAPDPMLFPATAAALEEAREAELTIVKITRDYRVDDEARDETERTYGEISWKRADGETEPGYYRNKPARSKPCDHSVLGVVVAGPGRGEAFPVCVAKKTCAVHWLAGQRESAKRIRAGRNGQAVSASYRDEQAKRREQQAKATELERWEAARPRLLEAAVAALRTAPVQAGTPAAALVIGACRDRNPGRAPLEPGTTAEDLLRHCAALVVRRKLQQSWWAAKDWPRLLKPFGVDARKLVDEVSPKKPKGPGGKPALQTRAQRKQGKLLAGDVRRARKAKRGAAT